VKPSQKHTIGAVHCKKEGMLLQPLQWHCIECVIDQTINGMYTKNIYINVARTSNNRVILSGDLYCCLLPQCEALRICRSGFPIATLTLIRAYKYSKDVFS